MIDAHLLKFYLIDSKTSDLSVWEWMNPYGTEQQWFHEHVSSDAAVMRDDFVS